MSDLPECVLNRGWPAVHLWSKAAHKPICWTRALLLQLVTADTLSPASREHLLETVAREHQLTWADWWWLQDHVATRDSPEVQRVFQRHFGTTCFPQYYDFDDHMRAVEVFVRRFVVPQYARHNHLFLNVFYHHYARATPLRCSFPQLSADELAELAAWACFPTFDALHLPWASHLTIIHSARDACWDVVRHTAAFAGESPLWRVRAHLAVRGEADLQWLHARGCAVTSIADHQAIISLRLYWQL